MTDQFFFFLNFSTVDCVSDDCTLFSSILFHSQKTNLFLRKIIINIMHTHGVAFEQNCHNRRIYCNQKHAASDNKNNNMLRGTWCTYTKQAGKHIPIDVEIHRLCVVNVKIYCSAKEENCPKHVLMQ